MIVNTGFDPYFGDPLRKFRAALASLGIDTNIISGVRSDEDQRQLSANRDATLAGRPLPYPDRGPVHVAAAPGSSVHQIGLGADVQPANPADVSTMHRLASQFGLAMPNWGGVDPYHVQLANWQGAAASQAQPTPWDQTNPANVPSQLAMNMEADAPGGSPPSRPASGAVTVKPDLLTSLQHFESGGRNVPNVHQGTSSGQAQGYNQITTGTWNEFGGQQYAPTPLQATLEQQNAIAAKIPLRRWAPETLDYLRGQGFTLDPNKTLGENIAANHGVTPTAPGAAKPADVATQTQPTPQAQIASSIGQALSSLSNAESAGSVSGGQALDPPDAPPIRAPALGADFMSPPTNPVPASLAGGLGSQLGSLAIQPQTQPLSDPSITQGAPSMTAMLGQVGTSNDPTAYDPRRTGAINPYARVSRIG